MINVVAISDGAGGELREKTTHTHLNIHLLLLHPSYQEMDKKTDGPVVMLKTPQLPSVTPLYPRPHI